MSGNIVQIRNPQSPPSAMIYTLVSVHSQSITSHKKKESQSPYTVTRLIALEQRHAMLSKLRAAQGRPRSLNSLPVDQLTLLESFMYVRGKDNPTTKLNETDMEIEIIEDDNPEHSVSPLISKTRKGGAFYTQLPAYISARIANTTPAMSRSATTTTPTTSSATEYDGKMDIEGVMQKVITNGTLLAGQSSATEYDGKMDIEGVMLPLSIKDDDDDIPHASQQKGPRQFMPLEVHEEMTKMGPRQFMPLEVHEEMTKIFKDVYKRHGPGLSESTYQRAAVRRAYLDGIPVMMERELFADFGDGNLLIGRVDIEVASSCLYELKIGAVNPQAHTSQVLKYIRAYDSSQSDDIKIASLVYFTPNGVVIHDVRNDCTGRAKQRR
jgi:GxxExxY protein